MATPGRGVLCRNPTTGIAGCCARAASGHAAAAPPSSVMNSRRFMSLPSPWQFAQQLLRNAYDVVFTVI
jgi:hypothetical protein